MPMNAALRVGEHRYLRCRTPLMPAIITFFVGEYHRSCRRNPR
jgi:hypothetical protein